MYIEISDIAYLLSSSNCVSLPVSTTNNEINGFWAHACLLVKMSESEQIDIIQVARLPTVTCFRRLRLFLSSKSRKEFYHHWDFPNGLSSVTRTTSCRRYPDRTRMPPPPHLKVSLQLYKVSASYIFLPHLECVLLCWFVCVSLLQLAL